MVNNPLFTEFYTSQMVQDFCHQQYDYDPRKKSGTGDPFLLGGLAYFQGPFWLVCREGNVLP